MTVRRAPYQPDQEISDYTARDLATSSAITGDFTTDSLKYGFGPTSLSAEDEEFPDWVDHFLPGPNINPHDDPAYDEPYVKCETNYDCPNPARTGPFNYSGGYIGKITACRGCWQDILELYEEEFQGKGVVQPSGTAWQDEWAAEDNTDDLSSDQLIRRMDEIGQRMDEIVQRHGGSYEKAERDPAYLRLVNQHTALARAYARRHGFDAESDEDELYYIRLKPKFAMGYLHHHRAFSNLEDAQSEARILSLEFPAKHRGVLGITKGKGYPPKFMLTKSSCRMCGADSENPCVCMIGPEVRPCSNKPITYWQSDAVRYPACPCSDVTDGFSAESYPHHNPDWLYEHHVVQGLSAQDIARMLGIPVNLVTRRIHEFGLYNEEKSRGATTGDRRLAGGPRRISMSSRYQAARISSRYRAARVEKTKDLLSRGYRTKEIAEILGVSNYTVKTYRREIRAQFNAEGDDPVSRIAAGTNDALADFANAHDTDDGFYLIGGLIGGLAIAVAGNVLADRLQDWWGRRSA